MYHVFLLPLQQSAWAGNRSLEHEPRMFLPWKLSGFSDSLLLKILRQLWASSLTQKRRSRPPPGTPHPDFIMIKMICTQDSRDYLQSFGLCHTTLYNIMSHCSIMSQNCLAWPRTHLLWPLFPVPWVWHSSNDEFLIIWLLDVVEDPMLEEASNGGRC